DALEILGDVAQQLRFSINASRLRSLLKTPKGLQQIHACLTLQTLNWFKLGSQPGQRKTVQRRPAEFCIPATVSMSEAFQIPRTKLMTGSPRNFAPPPSDMSHFRET